MQLTLNNKFATYVPPKAQLLKWVGNKQRVAGEITRFFPSSFNQFHEPFIGSGAIIATVSPLKGFASDSFGPLVEIWEKLKNDPDGLVEWYDIYRSRLEKEEKKSVYEEVKASFNESPNGRDFLFLTRQCYGGIVRFRKADGFMSTPCGVHTAIATSTFKKRVKDWHFRLKDVTFQKLDYRDAFDLAKPGDLIYCDPPYSHSQSILYGAQEFKLIELLEKIDEVSSKGVRVALSIDGNKKSGKYLCDLPIPEGLFKEEIFIKLGKSMLRRFQLEGEKMESEDVSDRLLLNYTV